MLDNLSKAKLQMSGRQRSNSGPPTQMETENPDWEKFRRSSGSRLDKKDSSEKSSEQSDQADRVNRAAEALWPKDGGKTPSFYRNLQSLAHVNVPDKTRSYVPRPTGQVTKPSGQPLLRPASQGQLTGVHRSAHPIPNAPPVRHVFTPGTRANLASTLDGVQAQSKQGAKRR